MGLVLGEHLFGSVVVSCAEDGFKFGLGFGKYALEFIFHGKLCIDGATEVFEGVPGAECGV